MTSLRPVYSLCTVNERLLSIKIGTKTAGTAFISRTCSSYIGFQSHDQLAHAWEWRGYQRSTSTQMKA